MMPGFDLSICTWDVQDPDTGINIPLSGCIR